jgi:FMN phosphatase YigB (HAD superfamily)
MVGFSYIFIILCIILAIVLYRYIQERRAESQLYYYIKPYNTVFAFDLHGVILQSDVKKMVRMFWSTIPFRFMLWSVVTPRMWYYGYKLYVRDIVPEQFFDFFDHTYPQFKDIRNKILDIANAQHLNEDVVQLIKSLKKQGYFIFLASNISRASLKKAEKTYPILTELFDGTCIPEKHNNYARKPRHPFYKALKHAILIHNPIQKHIVLIDNYHPNIKHAYLNGIHGITFKTAQQVVKRLSRYGITRTNT